MKLDSSGRIANSLIANDLINFSTLRDEFVTFNLLSHQLALDPTDLE